MTDVRANWLFITAVLLGSNWPAATTATESIGAGTLVRRANETVALTNTPVGISVAFTNDSATALRGFYYVDQLPAGLTIISQQLKLNGQAVSNYVFETGWAEDVFAAATPHRWILEQPPGFSAFNPLPVHATVTIDYTVSATAPGDYRLSRFSWVAWDAAHTNAVFGFSHAADEQTLTIVPAFAPEHLALSVSNQVATLTFATVAGVTYRIESRNDFSAGNWTAVTAITGSGTPAHVTEAVAAETSRFYRVRVMPGGN